MANIILVAPLFGNGGIASWTQKFIKTFPSEEFIIYPVSLVRKAKNIQASKFTRILTGALDMIFIKRNIKRIVHKENIDILHITTSASLGTYRDRMVGEFCKKHNIKCVIHYRYGNLPNELLIESRQKKLLLETMSLYDNIWVLDRKTFDAISKYPHLKDKLRLTPNSIVVENNCQITPKQYTNFIFMANIVPSKGVFELIEAIKKVKFNIKLHIVGPTNEKTMIRLKEASCELWGNKIIYHGKLANDKAVELLKNMDSLILPTYYAGEAFPMSILEAMSYGKLIISTYRAAIPDMLAANDGSNCGILVEEKSVDQLVNAINWCIENKSEADKLCLKAYQKVYNSYRTEVVYEKYRNNYRKLLNS